MSKRFSDSDKWTKNKWFRKLSTKHKLFWIYLLDSCDNVGVWEEDVELASFLISEPIDKEEVLKVFNEQIKIINGGKKWWIRKFVDYQYGVLDINNTKNRPHQCFIKTLMRHRLWIDYKNNSDSPKEKKKEKDKEKDKEKELLKEKQFEEIWNKYPSKLGKEKARGYFNIKVKIEKDWQDINIALENYFKSERVNNGYIQNGSTWFNNWRDWIDYIEPKVQQSQGIKQTKLQKDLDKIAKFGEE